MKCTNIQYLLIITIIILIIYSLLKNNINIDNINIDKINSDIEVNKFNKENTPNNYNYNNNNTITINSNNSNNNSNLNTNSSNIKNSNLNNIIVKHDSIYIDIKYILEDNAIKNVYTKATIPENLNNVLIYNIKNILSSIIHINTFNLKDLERIYEEIDQYNNRRYVVIFFVYNLNFFNSNKLVIDFIVNFDTHFIYLNTIKEFYNSYPNLVNKYDSLIYNRGFLDNNTIEEDLNEILKEDYLKNYKYSYLSDTSLDFTNIFLIESNKNLEDFSKIYLPNTQMNLIENNICDKNINGIWDKNGNLLKGTENCILHNSSSTKNIDVPDKYPYFVNDKHSNYYWMIDVGRNNIIRQHGYTI
jgi:hypothetical protein